MQINNLSIFKMENRKVLKFCINFAKFICVITCLYLFICSLDVLSTSFKLLAGKAMGMNTDYGRPMKRFFIEIPNFWAWADKLGR